MSNHDHMNLLNNLLCFISFYRIYEIQENVWICNLLLYWRIIDCSGNLIFPLFSLFKRNNQLRKILLFSVYNVSLWLIRSSRTFCYSLYSRKLDLIVQVDIEITFLGTWLFHIFHFFCSFVLLFFF